MAFPTKGGGGTAIVSIDADKEFSKLARSLMKAAPEVWVATRAALRAEAQIVANDARSRASFSSRIPGSIKVRASTRGVSVVAGGEAAPDAAPLENKGQPGTFRHPVYGWDVWVDQEARPFLAPAWEAHKDKVLAGVSVAIATGVGKALAGGRL